jgi:signal transduction histidine kinase
MDARHALPRPSSLADGGDFGLVFPVSNARLNRITALMLFALIAIAGALCAILLVNKPSWPVTHWMNIGLGVVCLALFGLVRGNRASEASTIALVATSAAIAIDSFNPNRSFGLAAPLVPLLIVFATFIHGERALLLSLLGNCAWLVAVSISKPFIFELSERALRMQVIDASAYIVYFLSAGVVTLLAGRRLNRASQELSAKSEALALRATELEREVALRKQSESEEKARARDVAQLLEVSNSLASTLDLPQLLKQILVGLKDRVGYDLAFIAEFDAAESYDAHVLCCACEVTATRFHGVLRHDPAQDSAFDQLIAAQRPLLVSELGADTEVARSVTRWCRRNMASPVDDLQSVLLVPMLLRGKTLGMLALFCMRECAYDARQGELALAFANQSALAIETARAHGNAVRLAALNERTRLARELHDSVSQSLYGIVLGAHAARTTLAAGEVSKSSESIDYVLKLADAGLVEMRALIFELRPEQLQEASLAMAIERQIRALCVRHEIEFQVQSNLSEPVLPFDVKEAAYRIALQAAGNAVRHSRTKTLTLTIAQVNGAYTITVEDAGVGFDPDAAFAGSLGLISMRERAHAAGIQLDIDSAPGAGARVRLTLPQAQLPSH